MRIGMENEIFRIPNHDDTGRVCQHRDTGMTANNNQPLTGKHGINLDSCAHRWPEQYPNLGNFEDVFD